MFRSSYALFSSSKCRTLAIILLKIELASCEIAHSLNSR